MKQIIELLEKRGRLVEQMQAMTRANPEGFDAETQAKYDAIYADQDALKATTDRMEREEKIAAEMAVRPQGVRLPVDPENAAPLKLRATPEYADNFNAYLRGNGIRNALSVGTDAAGGFLTHESFDAVFREKRDHYNAMRQYCEVITTTGDHNIRLEDDNGVSAIIGEGAAYGEDDPTYLNVKLGAFKIGKIIKVSEELVNDSDFAIDTHIARKFGRSNGLAEESFFIAGTGTTQPWGITTRAGAVTPGAATFTDVVLLNLYHGLPVPYRGTATWIANDTDVRTIRGILDANDNFIWQPGLQMGQPDRILGRPYITSAYQPAGTLTFGDLMAYTIADRVGFNLQRLNELYAANGQVGFKGYARTDGDVTIAEAIKKTTPA